MEKKVSTPFVFPVTIGITICTLLIAAIFQSRAFIIGSLISVVALLFVIFRIGNNYKIYIFISLCLLTVTIARFYKTDSSEGRLLIYKISFPILKNNLLLGIGHNNFQVVYPEYQSDYFLSQRYTIKELLLADNTYFAFNDYYQFLIEWGLIGLLIIVFVTFSFLKVYQLIILKKKSQPLLFYIIILQLLVLLTAAFFTHLFEKLLYQIAIITLLLAFSYYIPFLNTKPKFLLFIWAFFIFFKITLYYRRDASSSDNQRFAEAKWIYDSGFKLDALNKFKHLHAKMKNDSEFLSYYGSILMSNDQLGDAMDVLLKAEVRFKYNDLYTNLGRCYRFKNELGLAEYYFIKAINMVPNRFWNRYMLFEFYRETKQFNKAVDCGRKILNLPIKIESFQVDKIRTDVSLELRDISSRTKL